MDNQLNFKKGETISERWKLIKEIGCGGNSQVFEATDLANFGQPIALKVITISVKEGDRRYQRFKDEIEIQRYFTSELVETILPLIDSNLPIEPSKDNPIWIAMPIAETASKRLKDYKKIEDVIEAIQDIGKALMFCINKKQGFLHRDIKPQNIFYYNDKWCLGDFGLVDFEGKKEITKALDKIGSAYFMSPEIINDSSLSSEKSEVYALAKCLYTLIVGSKFPIPGAHNISDPLTTTAIYIKHSKSSLIDHLIERSTKNDPDERIDLANFIKEISLWLKYDISINDSSKTDISELLKLLKAKDITNEREIEEHDLQITHIEKMKGKIKEKMDDFISSDDKKGRVNHSTPDVILEEYLQRNPISFNPPFGQKFCDCIIMRFGQGTTQDKSIMAGIGFIPLPKKEIIIVAGVMFLNSGSIVKWMVSEKVALGSAREESVIHTFYSELIEKFIKYLPEFVKWV